MVWGVVELHFLPVYNVLITSKNNISSLFRSEKVFISREDNSSAFLYVSFFRQEVLWRHRASKAAFIPCFWYCSFLVCYENKAVHSFTHIPIPEIWETQYHSCAKEFLSLSVMESPYRLLTSIIWKCGWAEMKQVWDGGNALTGIWQERRRRNRESCLLWHFILPANPKPTDPNSILDLSITKKSIISCPARSI